MAGQEEANEEEDTSVRPSVGEGVKRLGTKRTFQESQLSLPDESNFRGRALDGRKKTIPYSSGQPGAIATNRGSLEQPVIVNSGGEESESS